MSAIAKVIAIVLVLLSLLLAGLAVRMAVNASRQPVAPAAPIQAAAEHPPAAPAQPATRDVLHPVVVAARNLAAGSALTQGDVEIVQWPIRPDAAFDDSAGLIGEVLRDDLTRGEPLTQRLLVRGLSRSLKPGERAVAIALDDLSGAANRIVPGDLVDVFFTLAQDNREIIDTQSRLLLPRVRVLAFGAQSVDGPAAADAVPGRASGNAAGSRSAMLAVPLQEVNALLLASRSGKLQLVLRSPQDDARPDMALFPSRDAVLQARLDLPESQRQQLESPENLAYAGNSLRTVSGQMVQEPEPPEPAPPAAQARRRSIEVIRGRQSQLQHY